MISIIAAIGKNRELGKDNALLWHIPGELPRFKRITTGHPIIMGRKTFESIGRILPNRTSIIITRDREGFLQMANSKWHIDPKQFIVVTSLEQAIEEAKKVEEKRLAVIASEAKQSHKDKIAAVADSSLAMTKEGEIFIIGGGQIFAQALPLTDKLYLTHVDQAFEADTFFPDYSAFTKVVEKDDHEDGGYRYSFVTLTK
nr:Dihydrofolate reductase [uncultured bacterium]AIA12966.1 Dihydrofolate reductase [uncultured bacterium]